MNMLVCADKNWGIGNKDQMLVSIPSDKKFLQEVTLGKVIIGGRKAMEALPGGTTLKGRVNIVLTSKKDYSFSDAVIVHSMEEAMAELDKYPSEDIFVIGGESVFRQFLPYCDRVFVTKVDYKYEADAFFENLDDSEEWVMTHDSDEQTYYDLEYYLYQYKRV